MSRLPRIFWPAALSALVLVVGLLAGSTRAQDAGGAGAPGERAAARPAMLYRSVVEDAAEPLAGLAVPGGASAPHQQEDDHRPNVVLILTDDQGWGDLSLHGNEDVQTPHLDGLAREGARFDWFYVSPVCSPTRAELLTGRYHPRTGVYSTSAGGERLALDETTIAESFQAAGYATGYFGKWHNGTQYPYHPNARGFGEFYGFTSGHWGHYFDWPLEHNGERVQGAGYVTDDFTNHALRFMEQHREEPFFTYLAYNAPHSPMQVPDRFYNDFAKAEIERNPRYADREDVSHTRAALAMVENIDWNVGRILQGLDALGLAEETIVVFLSDNGPNGWRWNGGMKGRKGSTDEGGVRVPAFVRWPGHIEAGTKIPQIAGAIDMLPTLTDMAGVPIVGEKPLDGVSLKPLLMGRADSWPDREIFSSWRGQVSVRTQQYRLDHDGRLYDMAADPGQHHDLSDEHPAVAARLQQARAAWRKDVLLGSASRDRPFTVGYPAFPTTYLPARDGVGHGGIERSNRFPNASYFTNWTSTQDSITWDLDVATSGRYEAVVYYTARAQDLGSSVALSFGKHSVRTQITEAHAPPLVGGGRDRVPRQESYVKSFKPLRLGVLPMEAGRGILTLRATEVPGPAVMDVRYVRLRLRTDD